MCKFTVLKGCRWLAPNHHFLFSKSVKWKTRWAALKLEKFLVFNGNEIILNLNGSTKDFL